MRKLGLIGGMSWISTGRYYEQINRLIQQRTSPRHSAPLLIESLDFDSLYRLQDDAGWDRAAETLIASAQRLVGAGAEGIVITANSMHKVYRQLEAAIDVPIIHIAEVVGDRIARDEFETVALIGSRNVMTEGFYRRRLIAKGITLLPPDMDIVEEVDRIIYTELMLGKATRNAERSLRTIFTQKERDGAQAIVLACTELEMVVSTPNVLPIYDSTRIHAEAAADFILAES